MTFFHKIIPRAKRHKWSFNASTDQKSLSEESRPSEYVKQLMSNFCVRCTDHRRLCGHHNIKSGMDRIEMLAERFTNETLHSVPDHRALRHLETRHDRDARWRLRMGEKPNHTSLTEDGPPSPGDPFHISHLCESVLLREHGQYMTDEIRDLDNRETLSSPCHPPLQDVPSILGTTPGAESVRSSPLPLLWLIGSLRHTPLRCDSSR